jgi:hypothetical protein
MCIVLLVAMQRSNKLFRVAVAVQTGIVGLFCHLKDQEIEALHAGVVSVFITVCPYLCFKATWTLA